MKEWIEWLLGTGSQWPDLLSIGIGTACAWAVGILIETYVIPIEWPIRKQKALVILVTVVTAAIASTFVWGELDPHDSMRHRAIISVALSPLSPFTYAIIGRILTPHFPSIGSAWAQGLYAAEPPEPRPPPGPVP